MSSDAQTTKQLSQPDAILATQLTLIGSLQEQLAERDTMFDRSLDLVCVAGYDGFFHRLNDAWERLTGFSRAELYKHPFLRLIHPDDHAATLNEVSGLSKGGETVAFVLRLLRADGTYVYTQWSAVPLPSGTTFYASGRDVSAQITAEAALQASIRELSSPIIPIADDVVILPLIGSIDTARAQNIVDSLLLGISARRASYAIIDITGVKVVDTQVADMLLRATRAARLLGTRIILTGMSPEIAQTIVQLGVDFADLLPRATVQDGVAFALAHAKHDT